MLWLHDVHGRTLELLVRRQCLWLWLWLWRWRCCCCCCRSRVVRVHRGRRRDGGRSVLDLGRWASGEAWLLGMVGGVVWRHGGGWLWLLLLLLLLNSALLQMFPLVRLALLERLRVCDDRVRRRSACSRRGGGRAGKRAPRFRFVTFHPQKRTGCD